MEVREHAGQKMIAAHLHINFDSIEQTESGLLASQIWFTIGESAFPESGWWDFADVLLAWWVSALRHLSRQCTDTATFEFMDGPFELKVNLDGGSIECIESMHQRTIALFDRVDVESLLREIPDVATRLIEYASTRGISTASLASLARLNS